MFDIIAEVGLENWRGVWLALRLAVDSGTLQAHPPGTLSIRTLNRWFYDGARMEVYWCRLIDCIGQPA